MLARKRRITVTGLAILALAAGSVLGADPLQTRGRVDAVTVYRGQALVTRMVELPKEAGLHDVIVTDLPAGIIAGSVFAEVEGGAEVRHVRPRTRAVREDVREDVRKLDEQLAALGADIAREQSRVGVLSHHSTYLDKLESFTAPAANTELTRGVLNAETLQKLTAFLLAERERVAKETLEANARLAELARQTELVQRQKGEITGKAEKTAREAVLMVDVKQPGAKVRLKYLVGSATWSPSYTVHATTSADPAAAGEVDLHYQAIVSQMSGEDWTDVKMTLSTATPSVVARAPELDTLRVTLASAAAVAQSAAGRAPEQYAQDLYRARADAAQKFMNNSGPRQEGSVAAGSLLDVQRDNVQNLRKAASELQQAELALAKPVAAVAHATPAESVTVTYVLPQATSLPSRADQQLVGITTSKMKGDFYKLAVPVLTSYVYNEAEVVNASSQLLLAGPTMSYLDGQFVGAGELPTVAAGERFTVGFGVDSSLRVTRELADKSESISGGNKITSFDYAIAVENFGTQPARVRVLDRTPIATGKDLKVTLVASAPKHVEDAEGLKKRGQLRWDVDVKPGSIGSEALRVTYSLTIEHDRNLGVVGAAE